MSESVAESIVEQVTPQVQKTPEERLLILEKQHESLTNILHQFINKVQDLSNKHAEMGAYIAAVTRTIFDNKPLTREGLTESSILNRVDQLNAQIQLAVKNGLVTPTDTVGENSVIIVQQFNEQQVEVQRRLVLDYAEMSADVKSLLLNKKVNETVVVEEALDDVKTTNSLVIHEVYNKVDKNEQALA